MVLFASPPQKHHHFPVSTQVLQFHYSCLRLCWWQLGRGLRMPRWEKLGLCKSYPPLKGQDNQMTSQILVCSLPIPMTASSTRLHGFEIILPPHISSTASLHLSLTLKHQYWPTFANFGFIPSVHLGDMSGRTPPRLSSSPPKEIKSE